VQDKFHITATIHVDKLWTT